MTNSLIIHGHFYQPPREDPWTGLIPYQQSAKPYHDWNKRITKECYAANASSRVLDPDGNIIDIVNNYEYMSFNFGPTLLSYIKTHARNVYESIIEGDTLSRKRNNGHGNAMAQVYNHQILPLQSKEDVQTQIIWGKHDFFEHFGRMPEGMWLSETAVNYKVIDILIKEGIKFIVLSPWQAEAVCPVGSQNWRPLHSEPAPSYRSYQIDRHQGSIAVFFYNHQLAQGISFENHLHNADTLYSIIQGFTNPQDESHLINTATDGEVYGHHRAFGDMCFAALTGLVTKSDAIVFTNYADYLEKHPPKYIVKLKEGEESKGTSWSCTHGVSRWYKDCGCSTGGQKDWDQKWRTPLRNAFNILRRNIETIFSSQIRSLSHDDPEEIRNEYIKVMNKSINPRKFAGKHLKSSDPEDAEISHFLTLLEGMKYSHFMFTSCAWFFADISGIEAVQNIHYAYRAIQLYEEYIDDDLLKPMLEELKKAKSNIEEMGTGADIFKHFVAESAKGPEYIASVFILFKILGDKNAVSEKLGYFRIHDFMISNQDISENKEEQKGRISIMDLNLEQIIEYSFHVIEDATQGVFIKLINESGKQGSEQQMDLEKLPFEAKELAVKYVTRQLEKRCMDFGTDLLDDIKRALNYAETLHTKTSSSIHKLGEIAINLVLKQLIEKRSQKLSPDEIEHFEENLLFAEKTGLHIDYSWINARLSQILYYRLNYVKKQLDAETINYMATIMKIVWKSKLDPDITLVQNIVFEILEEKSAACFESLENEDFKGIKKLKLLIKLGRLFGINVSKLENKLLEF